uniref:NFACT RNA-binding domain-containing protein n=1 Tax=Chlamydomonas euryale TaxID=1486919 RepID=A0A7R9YUD1_9CHLO|mmetsp:Transcript_24923/g.73711  ORF Transcript_24923/g.73711 Transcript_24923/m.73711 type:complete len:219 (+) Transcript_24923:275-931(+)
MVFYYRPRGCEERSDDWLIYMGKDKFENEDLIRFGLPVDVWFHVDGLSSAHVYLRLPEGAGIGDIPPGTLEDCAQLVKQNSIMGCKENNVVVVYTPWSNLRKTAAMDVGQVSFHDNKKVLKVTVAKKINEIVNRLEKTCEERHPDLEAEQQVYMRHVREANKVVERQQRRAEKAAKEEARRAEEQRSYRHIMKEEYMESNQDNAAKYKSVEELEDDFM